MILSSTILIGFIRLILLLLFLYYCNNKLVKRKDSHTLLQFIVNEWFKYGSLSIIILFALIQLQIYSLINFLLILLFLILLDVAGIKNLKNPVRFFKEISKERFFEFIKNNENKKSIKEIIQLEKPKKIKDDRVFIFYITIVLILAAFIGRYYFYIYDIYLLSDLWLTDLYKIIQFDSNNWFSAEVAVEGELAFANLYSKLLHVSPEVALQSLSIIEDVLLSLIIFWSIRKLAFSPVFAPLVAFFGFLFLYTFSPIELHYLLQNQPVKMGITFCIPAMIYTMRPDAIKFKNTNFFISFVICFFAIGLIDLFTLLILMPPFLIISLLFSNSNFKYFKLYALGAYITGTGLILATYYFLCMYNQNDFLIFLQSSLISVSSFTYMPNLAIPFEQLLTYYQYVSLLSVLVLPFLIWYKKEDWKAALAFILYFNFLVTLSFLKIEWIDEDLLRLALAVFIPITLGISVGVIIRLFYPILKSIKKYEYHFASFFAILVLTGIIYSQKNVLDGIKSSDKAARVVLDAYDEITHNYFPLTYAVVNDNTTQTISLNKHFFINYEDFLLDYLESDTMYHKNKKKPNFLIDNPQYVIPKSILVFVYKKNKEENNPFADQKELEPLLLDIIETLKKRGREVNNIYQSTTLDVYEIVNEPKSSRIDDLIY